MFSLEILWIELLTLKGFALVGLENKAKIRFLYPPSLGDMVKCVFRGEGITSLALHTKSQPPIMP